MKTKFSTIWEIVNDTWVLVRTYPTPYAKQVLEMLDQKYPGRFLDFPKGINPNEL